MLDIGTKGKYFHNILKEVYKIIEINYNMKDSDMPKLVSNITKHLEMYNSKSGMIRMGCHFDEEESTIDIFLSDYVRGRGSKKVFNHKIGIKSILRDQLIDQILNDDDIDIEQYLSD